ncbi:hypothetical protein J3U13_08025 [Gilliamella sp. B2887]|nr:hypothetical protein [Gilliamella sp. B2887]
MNKKPCQQYLTQSKNNQISNIEAIINNLGHDIIQPDLRLIQHETQTQYDEDISEINKLSNKAFNAIIDSMRLFQMNNRAFTMLSFVITATQEAVKKILKRKLFGLGTRE